MNRLSDYDLSLLTFLFNDLIGKPESCKLVDKYLCGLNYKSASKPVINVVRDITDAFMKINWTNISDESKLKEFHKIANKLINKQASNLFHEIIAHYYFK